MMIRRIVHWLLGFSGVVAAVAVAVVTSSVGAAEGGDTIAASNRQVIRLIGNACRQGIHHQPHGPFAVIAFCEDALGAYIAVACYNPGVCKKSELPDKTIRFDGWSFQSRTWQQDPWTSDVTAFAWSPDGKYLYVSTSEIYGSGGLYALNLEKRTFRQLLPTGGNVSGNHPADGYEIGAIDADGNHLHYLIGDPPVEHTLPLNYAKR
ncbi:MAG: hypothetical protein P4L95_05490 [Rouxiella aceris]|uniref:hypothetical protein n=1 Tax=Rouxiella aceris TaxID=2703884 RepID=UPI00284C5D5E|nr:hypothetical protein [Rouxiella aceris]MDR3431349.1 hypothetical protein [Rouxiella aceris]